MAGLPDEIWVHVLNMGVRIGGGLDYRDLCSLAMACRSLHHLSGLDCIWRKVSDRDFLQADEQLQECLGRASSGFVKGRYRSRFEKVKAAKLAKQKRLVLRLQSHHGVLEQECRLLEDCIQRERENLLNVLSRFKDTEKARHASVALQLWQPQVVRTMHEQVVEQQPVDLDACRQLLNMEAKVCREQITRCERSIGQKRCIIGRIDKELESLTYNPVKDLHVSGPSEEKREGKIAKSKFGQRQQRCEILDFTFI